MKLMLIGDPHFANHKIFGKPTNTPGVNSRCEYVTKTLQYWATKADELEVSQIFILGDITHYHGTLTPPIAGQIELALIDLMGGKRFVGVLSGNHDMDGNEYSIVPFVGGEAQRFGGPNLSLVEGLGYRRIKQHTALWMCSYGVPVDTILRDMKNRRVSDEVINRIFLMHHSFQGAVHGAHEFEPPGGIKPEDIPDGITVFSGHYHKRQEIKGADITYIGAPLQHDFGEATYTPGVTIIDFDEHGYYEESFHETPRSVAPRFEILDWDVPPDGIPGNKDTDYYRIDLPADVDPKEIQELKDQLTNVVVKPIPLDSQLRSRVEEVLGDLEDEDGNDRQVTLDDTIEAYAHMHVDNEDRARELTVLGKDFVRQMLGDDE
jgi:hypothetical protein